MNPTPTAVSIQTGLLKNYIRAFVGRQLKVLLKEYFYDLMFQVDSSIIFIRFDISSRVLNNICTCIKLLKKASKLQIWLQPKVHYDNCTAVTFLPLSKDTFLMLIIII